jgi:lysophospholipase L1-like esterase
MNKNLLQTIFVTVMLVVAGLLMLDNINLSLLDIHHFRNDLAATQDSVLGFRLRKSSEMKNKTLYGFRHNSYGFIGQDFQQQKPKNTYRIICVGGSTTYGAGVETDRFSYPFILQQIFEKSGKNSPVKFEVINAGVFGYNSLHSYIQVKKRLDIYNADLYIVMDGLNDLDAALALARQQGYGKEHVGPEFELVGYEKNLQGTISSAASMGIQTVIVSDPLKSNPSPTPSSLFHKNEELSYLLAFGRSNLPQINARLAAKNNIPFVNAQTTFDAVLSGGDDIRRVWADDLHLTRYGYYLLARDVYRELMTMPAIQKAAGTKDVATDEELDALFPELVLWRPADGMGWPRQALGRNEGIETINVDDSKPTDDGWSAYTPKDPVAPATISLTVEPGTTKVKIYPRIENTSDCVTISSLLPDGQRRALFNLSKSFVDGQWTPESAWYVIKIPVGQTGKVEIQLTGNNAQLWHKGNAVLFQAD